MTLVPTLTSGLVAAFSAVFADLLATLDSIFLFVTDAFNWADTGVSAALAGDFVVVFSTVPAALVDAAALTFFEAILTGALAATIGLLNAASATFVFFVTFAIFFTLGLLAADFATVLAPPLDGIALAGAGFAFFAEDIWDFAGFFIAFAMGSTAKMINSAN